MRTIRRWLGLCQEPPKPNDTMPPEMREGIEAWRWRYPEYADFLEKAYEATSSNRETRDE